MTAMARDPADRYADASALSLEVTAWLDGARKRERALDGVAKAAAAAGRPGQLRRQARELRESGPWGSGFPEPLFSGNFRVIEQRTVGENHLKLSVQCPDGGTRIDAIAFNQAGPAYRGDVQLTFRLDVNEYRGFESPQMIVEQIVGQS